MPRRLRSRKLPYLSTHIERSLRFSAKKREQPAGTPFLLPADTGDLEMHCHDFGISYFANQPRPGYREGPLVRFFGGLAFSTAERRVARPVRQTYVTRGSGER